MPSIAGGVHGVGTVMDGIAGGVHGVGTVMDGIAGGVPVVAGVVTAPARLHGTNLPISLHRTNAAVRQAHVLRGCTVSLFLFLRVETNANATGGDPQGGGTDIHPPPERAPTAPLPSPP
jgi:hypothetical protein